MGENRLYFKLPMIISEVILAFTIYKFSIEYTSNERLAYWTSAIFLLEPWTYFQTVIYGHFDIIPTLFMVLALYLLVKERIKFSALSLGIGIMFKVFPIVLLPIIALYFIRQNSWYRVIEYIVVVAIVGIFVSLPFLILSYDAYISVMLAIGGTRGVAIHKILFYLISRAGMSRNLWSSIMRILWGGGLIFTLLIFIKREVSDANFALLEESTFFLLIFLLLTNALHEQYIVWAIPFLILFFLGKNPIGPQLGDMVLFYSFTSAIFFYRVVKWSVWFSLYNDFGFVLFSTFAVSILFFHFVGWLIVIRFFRNILPKDIFQSFKDTLPKLTKWLRRSDEKRKKDARLRSYMTISSLQIDFSILYGAIVTGIIIVMFVFQGKTDVSFELFLFPIMLSSIIIAALLRIGLFITGIKSSNAFYTFINFWIIYMFEVGIYFHTDLLTILARALLIALSSSLGYLLVSLIEKIRLKGDSVI
jgi:Gpi18-like mannosyltransferase